MSSSIRDEVPMKARMNTWRVQSFLITLCAYNALTSQEPPLCGMPPFSSSYWRAVSPALPQREAFLPGICVHMCVCVCVCVCGGGGGGGGGGMKTLHIELWDV